jgi:hypothetical protein
MVNSSFKPRRRRQPRNQAQRLFRVAPRRRFAIAGAVVGILRILGLLVHRKLLA